MARIQQFGILGGLAAVALIAHLWMIPTMGERPSSLDDQTAATIAPAVDEPAVAACPAGMAACHTTGAEEPREPLGLAISTLPVLLWMPLRRIPTTAPVACSGRGPPPPLSPVDARVLLLE